MNVNTPDKIIDQVKNLISTSIEKADFESPAEEPLHKALLEWYFDAKNVEINYNEKIIKLQLPVSPNNFTKLTFECLEISGFLKACLKKDSNSIGFYKNLLKKHRAVHAA